MTHMNLILASGSPRRQQMLRDLGVPFKTHVPDIDESRLKGEPALVYVQRLAQQKAQAVAHAAPSIVSKGDWAILAADTIVVLGSAVLGKPKNEDDAYRMLRKLSGRTHEVITGYCWLGSRKTKPISHVNKIRTKVAFSEMTDAFWRWYVKTGEPMDKAGSYAAQGIGVAFIEKVSGSYSNVIGLPLPQVLKSFEKAFGENLFECCSESR